VISRQHPGCNLFNNDAVQMKFIEMNLGSGNSSFPPFNLELSRVPRALSENCKNNITEIYLILTLNTFNNWAKTV